MKHLRKFLLKNRIAPKWAVFGLDMLIACFAIVYANYLRFNFDFQFITLNDLIDDLVIVIVTNSILFYIFKTFHGIIRFSGFQEAFRSIAAIFYSFFIMIVMNVILSSLQLPQFTPISVLFIYFFIASFLLFGYRLLVKHLYSISINNEEDTHVVIYGAGQNGSLLKKTIEQTSNNRYKIVAFIDDEEDLIGKTIDTVKIYPVSHLQMTFKNWQIKTLFFAKQDFDLDEKNKIVDYCLESNVKVMNIPPMKEWIQGHLNVNQLKEVKIEELLGRKQISLRNEHVINHLRDKKILITGAAGSIGSELARQIASVYPSSLILCDQTETGLYELEYELQQKYSIGNALKVYLGDVKDKCSMQNLFSNYSPEVVFHAAAYKHVPMMENHPSEAIRNNVLGTKTVADFAEQFGVDTMVLVSTDKAINPTNVMGASKRIAEMYCQALQNRSELPIWDSGIVKMGNHQLKRTKFITTRFGNVLGSNGSVIPRFQEQITNGGPVTVTHPDIIRYFMTIPEACSLVLEAGTMGKGGEVFLFDMGEPIRILDLAKKMIRLAGLTPGKDIELRFTGLRPGEKLFEELLNKEEEVIPTHNKKILIAKVIEFEFSKVSESINMLISLANQNQDEDVVKQMKFIVPEFISNNSIYESIDAQMFKPLYSAIR
ncbi:MAG TPA: nucleoside-diphosphate sugar epimerase/dehydratase [Chitinophagaceae bacterium]|nr:polysaccharide biosynthesis protein [Chitinophagaceae bacterium]HNM33993.1 nucleoside-diphosphate sugar epimerase/dehydratase [Chitinophagaceae bacterium]HNN31133.1 nucleoside-diphosphate sugar epimerase/dehydratase [Chitinophagaceae bacterium]